MPTNVNILSWWRPLATALSAAAPPPDISVGNNTITVLSICTFSSATSFSTSFALPSRCFSSSSSCTWHHDCAVHRLPRPPPSTPLLPHTRTIKLASCAARCFNLSSDSNTLHQLQFFSPNFLLFSSFLTLGSPFRYSLILPSSLALPSYLTFT